jgi:hypothetical protein
MEILRFPRLVFIDRRGIIRSDHVGFRETDEKEIRAKILELLQQPVPIPKRAVAR